MNRESLISSMSPSIEEVPLEKGIQGQSVSIKVETNESPTQYQYGYKDVKKLGILDLEEISSRYQFDQLDINNDQLVLNHKTRVIVQNLVNDLPATEILDAEEKLKSASSMTLGEQASTQLIDIILRYSAYTDYIHALDEQLNNDGVTQDDIDWNVNALIEAQDKIFGEEQAKQLFEVERKTRIAMSDFEQQMSDRETFDAFDVRKMNERYAEILAENLSISNE